MDNYEVEGVCLHGRSLRTMGNTVVFVDPCPDCIKQLTGEGYLVRTSAVA